ncbi:MAG: hypothetical protein J6B96_01805 [Agathobacter sp.]|nr:hypothetical protein [Agathobacter sp.]
MKSKDNIIVNKYIAIFHKRNILTAFLCTMIVFVPLFAVALIFDVIESDILIAFIPFLLAILFLALASFYTIRFKQMIVNQEKLYSVRFNDENAEHLETTIYLSNEWLICAGISAIHKEHIKAISSTLRYGQAGASNEIIVKTADDKKYRIWRISVSNVQKIRNWKDGK